VNSPIRVNRKAALGGILSLMGAILFKRLYWKSKKVRCCL
jgi:hypothetical protein